MTPQLQPTGENAANIENYEKAQSTINKVLDKVAALRDSETNAELKRQIEELDEAYENAIRLRILRINTLQAHCDDRDSELVTLRKRMMRSAQTNRIAIAAALCAVLGGAVVAIRLLVPELCAAVTAMAWASGVALADRIAQSPLGTAATSCVLTLLISKTLP